VSEWGERTGGVRRLEHGGGHSRPDHSPWGERLDQHDEVGIGARLEAVAPVRQIRHIEVHVEGGEGVPLREEGGGWLMGRRGRGAPPQP